MLAGDNVDLNCIHLQAEANFVRIFEVFKIEAVGFGLL
jgi:hypothetical protein